MKLKKIFEDKINWNLAKLNPYNNNEQQRCTRCNELLKQGKIIYLELNQNTLLYSKPGNKILKNESQGYFPFGLNCAKKIIGNGGKCDMWQGIR